jgi:hypothetical protein
MLCAHFPGSFFFLGPLGTVLTRCEHTKKVEGKDARRLNTYI